TTIAPWLEALRDGERRGMASFPSDAARRRWESIRTELVAAASLSAIVDRADHLLGELTALEAEAATPSAVDALQAVAAALRDPGPQELLVRLRRLADSAEALAAAMDFRPLYRADRHLFAIGFNLVQNRLDNTCYDLMASECCLTSYLT